VTPLCFFNIQRNVLQMKLSCSSLVWNNQHTFLVMLTAWNPCMKMLEWMCHCNTKFDHFWTHLLPTWETGDGHGSAVDWWTFGIFLYELLFGKTPFKGAGNRATLFNVVGQPLKFPESATGQVSFAARDLIRGLLVKEPLNRLASKRGAAEIKAHPFFEGNINLFCFLFSYRA